MSYVPPSRRCSPPIEQNKNEAGAYRRSSWQAPASTSEPIQAQCETGRFRHRLVKPKLWGLSPDSSSLFAASQGHTRGRSNYNTVSYDSQPGIAYSTPGPSNPLNPFYLSKLTVRVRYEPPASSLRK